MLSKNNLKFIKSLQIKKFRDEEGLFIVEGRKSVYELLDSDFQVEKLFCTAENQSELIKKALKKVEIIVLNHKELESISRFETNDSMLAIAHIKKTNQISFAGINKVLILDQIQDPGNLGTIIRTADWFGIKDIFCSRNTVDFYNPKVITATMGSFARANVIYTDLEKLVEKLKQDGFVVYGALLKGVLLQEIQSVGKYALVIGNESNGISERIESLIDQSVTIPGFGKAESLNASIAAAIIMHHFSGFDV